MVALVIIGCAKQPAEAPPDVNLWPTAQENNYMFDDGCVIRLEEVSEGCHLLSAVSGACNNIHGVFAEKTWVARNHPSAQLVNQSLSHTLDEPSRVIDSITINTEDGRQSFCFDLTELW